MNVDDIARTVREDTGMTDMSIADMKRVVSSVFNTTLAAVQAGDSVRIADFGMFSPLNVPAKSGNFAGKDWATEPYKTVKFKPATAAKH